jgi:hypothetical protein
MSTNQVKVGWRAFSSPVSGTDTDAQAFITAAGITDSTQQSAINTLVTQLKTYGIWTKMKALYPFVGGTATSHKFNLKDPRDLDAAYRLVFNGGWIHSSTGTLPNGSNAYAHSKFIPLNNATDYNAHLSYYSRTNNTTSGVDIGSFSSLSNYWLQLWTSNFGGVSRTTIQRDDTNQAMFASTTRQGFFIGGVGLSGSNSFSKIYQDGVLKNTNNVNLNITRSNTSIYLGALNIDGVAGAFANRESAFASIGDGLTDTDAANFYTAVQTFQTTLGRQVGVPIVSDSDAQAFLNAASITSVTQASAINTLVTDLKSANIWTKMKALYPMVGGTATTHKFNLKDPRDVDAAFRLVFAGGWTHTSTGALPNGTTGYANTFLNPDERLMINNSHMSFYSRTNTTVNGVSIGSYNNSFTSPNQLICKWNDGNFYGAIDNNTPASFINSDSRGNYIVSRTANNVLKAYKNESLMATNTTLSVGLNNRPLFIGARNEGVAMLYDNKESAFASIGDGLTDTEAANFYTAVQTFQTTLGRQVGTPVLAAGQVAGLLDTYSGASAAYSLRKLRAAYSGYAIRVRRSSDNTSQDIGFDANGNLDTTSMLSFVGVGNGFVTIWYDQSGNGRNVNQTTSLRQPKIVNSGSLIYENGKVSVDFDGINNRMYTSTLTNWTYSGFSTYVVSKSGGLNSNGRAIFSISNGSTNNGYLHLLLRNNITNNFRLYYSTDSGETGSQIQYPTNTFPTTQNLISTTRPTSGNITFKLNNILQSSTVANNINPLTPLSGNFMIGNYYSQDNEILFYLHQGTISEIIVYPNSQENNTNGIASNINSFYSIY